MVKKPVRDKLMPEELAEYDKPFYEVGRPYLWIETYGWCLVGFYVRHETPLHIRVAHGSYYQNAQKSHADLAREGPSSTTSWRYKGNVLVTVPQVIDVIEYQAEVPRGPVIVQ